MHSTGGASTHDDNYHREEVTQPNESSILFLQPTNQKQIFGNSDYWGKCEDDDTTHVKINYELDVSLSESRQVSEMSEIDGDPLSLIDVLNTADMSNQLQSIISDDDSSTNVKMLTQHVAADHSPSIDLSLSESETEGLRMPIQVEQDIPELDACDDEIDGYDSQNSTDSNDNLIDLTTESGRRTVKDILFKWLDGSVN